MQGKVNKYPYFLWLNELVSVSFDKSEIYISRDESEEQTKSHIHKVPKAVIFLMKHMLAIFMLVYIFYIPGVLPTLIGLCSTAIGTLLVIYFPKWFKKYILVICIAGLYMAFNDMALLFEHSLYVVSELTVLIFLVRETYCLVYDDEYYCVNEFSMDETFDGTSKVNLNILNIGFGGYYLRVKKRDIQNVSKNT